MEGVESESTPSSLSEEEHIGKNLKTSKK